MRKMSYVISFLGILSLTQAYEQQSFTKNNFELGAWQISYEGAQLLDCVSETLLAFNYVRSTIFRQFELPPHYKININVKFWRIYTYIPNKDIVWPGKEAVIGYLDDTQFDHLRNDKFIVSKQYRDGKCYPDNKNSELRFTSYNYQFEFIHRANTAYVIFTTNTYNDDSYKFWGISDFKLTISECPEGCAYCYNDKECDNWQKIIFTLFSTTEKDFSLAGWESPYKKIINCQNLIFFGLGASNTKKNENEIKTFKLKKVKPTYHYKIQFLFAILDYQKKNLELLISGKETTLYRKVFKESASFQHDLCKKNIDSFQIFERDFIDVYSDFNELEQLTFQVNQGNSELAPFVWGIRDIQIFVQYCASNCLKCRDAKSCITCEQNYIWDHYKQVCVPDDYAHIQSIRQFNSGQFTEIGGWTLINDKQGVQVGNCQVSLVGGLNILGIYGRAARQFKLDPHERVRIILNIYLFGDWENQSININVDGKLQKSTKVPPTLLTQKTCNSDKQIKAGILKQETIEIAHTKDSITIEIYATLDNYKNQASWGFRDFSISTFTKLSCATLFTQIDYQGEETQICQSGNEKLLISSDVKSIKVPSNSQIIMTTDTEEEISFLADTPSLDSKKFTLVQLSILQDQSDQNNDPQQETE